MIRGKRIAKTAFIIMMISLFSKILGFVREMVIAAKYGASIDSDAYIMSITIPSSVFVVVAGALATTFIPVLSEKIVNKSKKNTLKFINNSLNVTLFLCIGITALGIIYAPVLVKTIAPKFSGERYDLTVQLTKLTFPMVAFTVLSGVITGALQSFGRFAAPAATGLPYSIIIIFTALTLTDAYGIKGLAIATVVAGLAQVLIQMPSLFKEGYGYEFVFDIRDKGISKILLLTVPVMISTGVQQINIVIGRIMASGLAVGSISALNYGNRLTGFVSGIFIAAISTVTYPTMAKLNACYDMSALRKVLLKGMNAIILIISPAVTGLIALRYPIIRLLFERGAFDKNATQMTSTALLYLSFGLLGYGVRDLLNNAFYSIQDAKTPMINGIFTVTANTILLLTLVKPVGIGELALAASLSAILGAFILMSSLYKKIGNFGVKEFMCTSFKAIAASAIMGIIVSVSYKFMMSINGMNTSITQAVGLFTIIGIGSLVYLFIISLLNVEEVREIFEFGRRISRNALGKLF